jgi:predicted metal-binding transcription factor (methanogenesis marker protein 9)
MKPSDVWCISLCKVCHARQHQIGERAFEAETGINLKALAEAFLKRSPHKQKLETER